MPRSVRGFGFPARVPNAHQHRGPALIVARFGGGMSGICYMVSLGSALSMQ